MKAKSSILTVVLSLFLASGLLAQDKYDYAYVNYYWYSSKISVSINGSEFMEEKIELPKAENTGSNVNPLFAKINELQSKGWEVMSFATITAPSFVHYAYLRKKKN